MKQVITSCLLAASCLTLISSPVAAGNNYYRWVNERGNVVHSDRPPPQGIDYEIVDTISYQARQVEVDEAVADPEATAAQSPQPAEAPVIPKLQPEVVKDPAKCEAGRTNLAKLDSTARIRMKNDEGDMYFLSAEQKEGQRQKALKTIEVHCN